MSRNKRRKLTAKERKAYALTETNSDYLAYALGRGEDTGLWRGGAAYQTISVKDGDMSFVKTKYFHGASTNYLEIMAVMSAVNSIPKKKSIIVYTHSEYAARVLMNEWKAKTHLNLIENFRTIASERSVLVCWMPYNKCDFFQVLDEQIKSLPELSGVALKERYNCVNN